MLKHLIYTFTFATTGKTISGDIAFESGLTAITGPNEAGKSMVMESIRYALFGTEALRHKVASYKNIDVVLWWDVKGESYSVHRSLGAAQLYRVINPPTDPAEGGDISEMVASGTTAVNKKIENIFGYGLPVFDIAHFCNQGEVEALTKMKPTERKKMVDKVVGLDVLDVASLNVSRTLSDANASLKAFKMSLGEPPVAPVRPTPVGVSTQDLPTLEASLASLRADEAWLDARQSMTLPTDPGVTDLPPVSVLMAQEDLLVKAEKLRKEIGGLAEPTHSLRKLDDLERDWRDYDLWLDHEGFVQKHGEPLMHGDESRRLLKEWAAYENYERLKSEVAALEKTSAECPECGANFALDQQNWKVKRAELDALAPISAPSVRKDALERSQRSWEAWAKRGASLPAIFGHVPSVIKPPLSRDEITAQRRAHSLAPQRMELAEIEANVKPSVSQDLRERLLFDRQVDRYEDALNAWNGYAAERDIREERVKNLPNVLSEFALLKQQLDAEKEYGVRQNAYLDAKERYDRISRNVAVSEDNVEQYKRAGEAVKLLRTKVKTFLVPSLNVAASNLISTMTGGQRNSIVVSESFEDISVDGQPIETLSGSGKAVANLAIRLGLGQVLTNRVFSVFMGDEIDASMDADRAGSTAACFDGLSNVIGQIILVSHKNLPVQHQIMIGNPNAV